ncbi:MAG: hypothetical protein ABII21_00780 [bacterium]
MPKKTKKKVTTVVKPMVMRNQFLGMLILAVGIGALIVMVRYFIISLQTPADIYLIQPAQLIPGMGK